MKWFRFWIRGGAVAGVLVMVSLIPLPHRVKTAAVLQPKNATRVYVAVDGRLQEAVAPGTQVQPGEALGQLHNLDLKKEVIASRGQIREQELKLQNLKRSQRADPAAKAQIPAAEKALGDLQKRLADREENERRLTITAPIAGTVLPPPAQKDPAPEGELSAWRGSPLEKRNRGCFLQTGTLFCLIGDARQMEAVLIIDQSDMPFVRVGQAVRLRLDERPGEVLTGIVQDVAQIDLKVTPRELIRHEDLPTRMNEQGRPELVSTSYQARVELDPHEVSLLNGTTGSAKVETAPQSLMARLSRYLSRTFRLDASRSR